MNKFFLHLTAVVIASFCLNINNSQAMQLNNNAKHAEEEFIFLSKTELNSGTTYSKYDYQNSQQFIFMDKCFDLFVLPGKNKSSYIHDGDQKTYTDSGLSFYKANPEIKAKFFKQFFKNPFVDLAGSCHFDYRWIGLDAVFEKNEAVQLIHTLFNLYDQTTLEKLLFEESEGKTAITIAIENEKYALANFYIHMGIKTVRQDVLDKLLLFINDMEQKKDFFDFSSLAEPITKELASRNNATTDTSEQTTSNLNVVDQLLDVSKTSSNENSNISPNEIKITTLKKSTHASNYKKPTFCSDSDIDKSFSDLKIDQSAIYPKTTTIIPNKNQLNTNTKHDLSSTEMDEKFNHDNNLVKTKKKKSTNKTQNSNKSKNSITQDMNQSSLSEVTNSCITKPFEKNKNQTPQDNFFGDFTEAEYFKLQEIMLNEEKLKKEAEAAEKITFTAKKTEIESKIIHEIKPEPVKAKKQSRVAEFLKALKASTTDKKAFTKAFKDLKQKIKGNPLELDEIESIVDHFINKKDVLNFITFFDDMPITYEIFRQCEGLFNFICDNAQDKKVKNLFDAWNIDLLLDKKIKPQDQARAINVGLLQQITVPVVQEENIYTVDELRFKTFFADFLKENKSFFKDENSLIVKISNFNKKNQQDVNFFTSHDAKLKSLSSKLLLPSNEKPITINIEIKPDYYKALLYAAMSGNLDSVDWFLGKIKKLDSNIDSGYGDQSVLLYAISIFCTLSNHPLSLKIKIIEQICKHTLIETIINKARKKDGETALHLVAKTFSSPEIAKILIEAGADVNLPNEKNGDTPLHCAAQNFESPAMAKFLVQSGADMYSLNTKGLIANHFVLSHLYTESLHHNISKSDLKRYYALINNLTDSPRLKELTATFIMTMAYDNQFQEDAFAGYLKEYPSVLDSWIKEYGEHMIIPFIASTVSTSVLKILIEKDAVLVNKYLFKPVILRGKAEDCFSLSEGCSKTKYAKDPAIRFNAFKKIVNKVTKSTLTTNFTPDFTEDFDVIETDFSNMGRYCKNNLLIQAIEKNDINFIEQNDAMFKKLLDCGTDKDKKLPPEYDYVQALFWAIREKQFDCVCYFLNKVQWVNRIDSLQSPMPLLTHSILTRLLIKQDLDFACDVMNEVFTKYGNKFSINTVNEDNETLLHLACKRFLGKKLIDLILEQPEITITSYMKNHAGVGPDGYLIYQINDNNNNNELINELTSSYNAIMERFQSH